MHNLISIMRVVGKAVAIVVVVVNNICISQRWGFVFGIQ